MDFDQRLKMALTRVSQTGIWQSNYAPPIYHCLWFAGVEVPPPHYASFAFNAVMSGAWFGICWAVVIRCLFCPHAGLPMVPAAIFSILVGAIFGITMATYYAISAHRHGLPRWSTFAESTVRLA